MKMLFSSPDIRDVGLMRSMLEEAGIRFEVQNETIPYRMEVFCPEFWILDDAEFARACELRDVVTKSSPVMLSSWVCPSCGEKLEGQFGSCWKCGVNRD
jgi:hypothetical protein